MRTKLGTLEVERISIDEFHAAEKMPLVVVIDDVRSMHNVGSVFRTCDAFRAAGVFLCGITARPPQNEIHKTALGAEESVDWQYFSDAKEAVHQLHANGFKVYAVEQCKGSTKQPCTDLVQPREKNAVRMRNDLHGVQQDDIEIPQFGTKHSMNVSVTAGIIIWEFARKLML